MQATQIEQKQKIRFDSTVNLGHILTFIGFIVAGAGMYTTMDKRVTVLEVSGVTQRATDARQDTEMADNKRSVREDLKEISQKLDRLIERK